MAPLLAVDVDHPINPVILLAGVAGQVDHDGRLVTGRQQRLELAPQLGRAAGLERQHVLPPVELAGLEGLAAGQQVVAGDAQGRLGVVRFQLRGQSAEGLQFAVLLEGLGIGRRPAVQVAVVDELTAHRQGQPRGRYQLGLQDVVEVVRLVAVGLR